jgi:hypothetical protein
MLFAYGLKSTEETIPPWATPVRMLRREDVVDWKVTWNVQYWRYEEMVFTR